MKTPPLECVTTAPVEETQRTIICGSLCTIGDVLANESVLPKLLPNDFVVFKKAGAYAVTENIALFLSRDFPSVYTVKNGNVCLMRDRIQAAEFNTIFKLK